MEIPGRPASRGDARRSRYLLLGTVLLAWGHPMGFPGLHAQQGALLTEGTKALYQNDYAKSEALATRHLKTRPRDADGMILLARSQMAQGKLDAAFETLTKALRTQPRHIDALHHLSALSLLLARGQYEVLFTKAPDSARAHQLLGEEAEANSDLSRAEFEYRAAMRIDPESVEVLNALGLIEQQQFKFNEAIDYYSKAAAIQPRNFESLYGLGSCYLYLQQNEKASGYLQKALETDPSSPAAHFALGDAWLRLGKNEDAVTNLQASVHADPNLRQAYVLLARAYKRLGRSEEADKALAKSIELTQEAREKRADVLGIGDVSSSSNPEHGEKEAEPGP